MSTITHFEDIQAWQKAREVASAIYKLCRQGDLAPDWGLHQLLGIL